MGDKSHIEWTEATWNPTTGCDRVSAGCDNCYALTMAARLKGMGQAKYQNDGDPRTSGPGFALTVHPDTLDQPIRWTRPRRIFVNSMSDLFHKDVDEGFIASVFAVMALCPGHTFQVLTKRSARMSMVDSEPFVGRVEEALMARFPHAPLTNDGGDYLLPGLWDHDGLSWPLPNVWLGTSIETDRYAFRADHLCATPAAVRWLSLEPLLGPLPSLDLTGIDWVVVGGESGPHARPMHPEWVRDIRVRCRIAGVPFFFKQWGAWAPGFHRDRESRYVDLDGQLLHGQEDVDDDHAVIMHRAPKQVTGRVLDGRTWDEYPKAAG